MTLVQSKYAHWNKQFIAGEWVEGSSDKMMQNKNPYTGETLVEWRSSDENDLDKSYKTAQTEGKKWSKMPLAARAKVMREAMVQMNERKEEIVDLLIAESGSTRVKAEREWMTTVRILEESSSFPYRMKGELIGSDIPGKENRVVREAKGVIGVIGPWNFPLHLCMRSVAPALAVGNGVVIKPASDTPITAGLLIADIFEKAGLPKGVLSVVSGSGSEIGDAFVKHPIPKLISFTGSTEVGRGIGKLAGEHLKDVALELGGDNAMIVLDDADIDKAVEAAVYGKFFHQGQICMALNRIVVDHSIYDTFVEKFTNTVKGLKFGDPADAKTLVGPLIHEKEVDRLLEVIENAQKEGAKLLYGGKSKGSVLEPTVLSEVSPENSAAQHELFGPVALLIRAKDEADAIRIVNSSEYGLSGSVFTSNLERGYRVAQEVESGMIHVNDQPVNDEAHVMFGGEKSSGLGRFGGEWAIEKFTRTRWISIQHQYREFPNI